eukprot:Nitzschia sp. Nitz4//scaffold28_size193895//159767//160813//NITZ4_001683-RA/size193895-processed-gene-0.278-mRNA-1//-1//CDS//3329546036//3241//frame0
MTSSHQKPSNKTTQIPEDQGKNTEEAAKLLNEKTTTRNSGGGHQSMEPIVYSIAVFFGTSTLGFLMSVVGGWQFHLDLVGSGSFAVSASYHMVYLRRHSFSVDNEKKSPATVPLHQWYSCLMIAVWATKLAGFLLYRYTQVGEDPRLQETLSTVKGAFGFWMITFVWNVFCSMPHLVGLSSMTYRRSWIFVGVLVYLVGLTWETVGDAQKWNFKQSNPGKFCNVGLWALSQHPNFFGNIVLWLGIFIVNTPAMIFVDSPKHDGSKWKTTTQCFHPYAFWRLLVASISPMFLWLLFHGQAVGSIANATTLFEQKYGNLPGFQEYVTEVPLIIPSFWQQPWRIMMGKSEF